MQRQRIFQFWPMRVTKVRESFVVGVLATLPRNLEWLSVFPQSDFPMIFPSSWGLKRCHFTSSPCPSWALWSLDLEHPQGDFWWRLKISEGYPKVLSHSGLSENRVYSQWNSHLIGIMISKTIGFRGTLFSDKPILWLAYDAQAEVRILGTILLLGSKGGKHAC